MVCGMWYVGMYVSLRALHGATKLVINDDGSDDRMEENDQTGTLIS